MRILFLVPYPTNCAPSQRFRFEQYLPALAASGIDYQQSSFLPKRVWPFYYDKGRFASKAWYFCLGYLKRFLILFRMGSFDLIFIHREATPLGPGFYQWFLIKILKKKVIFDFDDAIWIPNNSEGNSAFSWLKRHKNAEWLMTNSWKNSCGNAYLQEIASQRNERSYIIPTTVDTRGVHNRTKAAHNGVPVIGWTGTHSTIPYLHRLIPILLELRRSHEFKFHVISDQEPHFEGMEHEFTKWTAHNEVPDLLQFDIGIMPLEEDQWSKGKCGLKALQYMALGIPCVASPVGVNTTIISHNVDGLLAKTNDEWKMGLSRLLTDRELRNQLGRAARPAIERQYSVSANTNKFLDLFAK